MSDMNTCVLFYAKITSFQINNEAELFFLATGIVSRMRIRLDHYNITQTPVTIFTTMDRLQFGYA